MKQGPPRIGAGLPVWARDLPLCSFPTVSVEQVELKGTTPKKNDRTIEYSFEVSAEDWWLVSFTCCVHWYAAQPPIKDPRQQLIKVKRGAINGMRFMLSTTMQFFFF